MRGTITFCGTEITGMNSDERTLTRHTIDEEIDTADDMRAYIPLYL